MLYISGMKITELQLQQLKDLNDSKVNEILGLGLQIGKWYKNLIGNGLFYITKVTDNKFYYYGFDLNKESYYNDWYLFSHVKLTPANNEEIETALIEEAKRRYKTNNIVKCKHHNWDTRIYEMLSFVFHENKLWSKSVFGNVCIFKDGKWAEVISNPIQNKIDKLRKEIDELESILNRDTQ